MGQSYRIVNVDKRMVIDPDDFGNGRKITEWAFNLNDMVLAMMNLIAGEWKGDRVYVVGDYAARRESCELWYDTMGAVLDELNCKSLYDCSDEFTRVVPEWIRGSRVKGFASVVFCNTGDAGYRYIYNHAERQVVSLEKCPVEWIIRENRNGAARAVRIAPLPLLLAMGNGRGAGDYRDKNNSDLVGKWCATSKSIEVSKERLKSASGYSELTPDFTNGTNRTAVR